MRKSLVGISLLALCLEMSNSGPNAASAATPNPNPVLQATTDGETAKSLQIRDSAVGRSYACSSTGVDSVQVVGSRDNLTITGKCGALQITGHNNSITIDSVKSLDFTGNSNSVEYRFGPRPASSDQGQGNLIARAKGADNGTLGSVKTPRWEHRCGRPQESRDNSE